MDAATAGVPGRVLVDNSVEGSWGIARLRKRFIVVVQQRDDYGTEPAAIPVRPRR